MLTLLAFLALVTIAWDPNPPEEQVTGYSVYYGAISRTMPGFTSYDGQIDVGNVTLVTLDIPKRYIAVVAYNAYGLRSDYSKELDLSAPRLPTTPTALGQCPICPPVPPPEPTQLWFVAPNGTATTRPVYDITAFQSGNRGTPIDRVTVITTSCGAAIGSNLNWRVVTGLANKQGTAYCYTKP